MVKNIGGGYVYNESDSSASYEDEGFSVESLNDVEVSDPENGQALVYDSSSQKWINGTTGLLVVNLTYDEEIDGLIADKTYAEVIAATYVVFISDGRATGDTTYYYPVCDYGKDSDDYFYVRAINGAQDFVNLYALTANDYLSTTYPPISV